MGLPDKGFARSEMLVFVLLLAPNIQTLWAKIHLQTVKELVKSVGEM